MKHKIDLDEARQIEQAMSPLPWIVLEEENGEMIIIRNSNHPMHKDGLIAWGQENAANTPDAIGIAYMRENFSNLIGEIERLRADLEQAEICIRARMECIDDQAAYIKELESSLDDGLLEYCLETLLDAPDIEEIPGPGHSIEMLRAMLREAEQCE